MKINIKYVIATLIAFGVSINTYAMSAIAIADGYIHQTFFVSYNNPTQKEADADAIRGCNKNVTGIDAKIKASCKVYARPKEAGFGAFVCGDNGCAWTYSYSEKQAAVDAAYEECKKGGFKNCQTQDIFTWGDFQGFTKETPVSSNGNCRPKTNTIRCQSSCTNGDCIVTYENGCKIRVQVNPKFDSFQNRWTYPSPSC